ncbi:hypothetical protein [Perlabentimonas gracilis]|uniref:hypothetical protein n=1 Tax=Perlabentimonas gracilis TaxID=2715279 RepID=UPI0014080AC1|nr:hypothetical protein [Perlabentimonas gracilis]
MLQPIFWMLMGILVATFFDGLRYWFQDLRVRMTWRKWALVLIWLFLLAFTLGAGFTLIGENEPKAGLRFMLFFGVIILITGSGLWKILAQGREKRKQ